MNARPNPKIDRAISLLILGSLPLVCLTAIVCLALFSGRHEHRAIGRLRPYTVQRCAADTRQAYALLHYLIEPEPSHPAPQIKVKASPPPLLTVSNYARLSYTNRIDPI